jgi:hypothetical protein
MVLNIICDFRFIQIFIMAIVSIMPEVNKFRLKNYAVNISASILLLAVSILTTIFNKLL